MWAATPPSAGCSSVLLRVTGTGQAALLGNLLSAGGTTWREGGQNFSAGEGREVRHHGNAFTWKDADVLLY